MNEEIYFLYKDLPKLQKEHLDELFNKSEKMKRLVQVVESKGRDLNTVYAVNFIYSEELEQVNFKILTNRFYKLRQEFKDWLLKQLKYSPVCLAKEEQELVYLRLLIINNEYSQAVKKLDALEKICWEKNLFEILYQVIELRIRCEQATHQFGLTEVLLDRYQLALQLFTLLTKLKAINFRRFSRSSDVNELKKLQKEIRPYKAYPRFRLLYYSIAFSQGFSKVSSHKQSLSRYLNHYKELFNKHSAIPTFYFEKYHNEKNKVYFLIKEASFYANMNEHKKSLKLLEEIIAFETEKDMDIYMVKNIPYISNKLIISLYSSAYHLSLDILEEYRTFQLYNNDGFNYPFECMLLDVYTQAFPFYTTETETLKDWLQISFAFEEKQQTVVALGLRQMVHLRVYIMLKEWEKAQTILSNSHMVNFYQSFESIFDFKSSLQELLNLLLEKDRVKLQQFKNQLKKDKKALKLLLAPSIWSWFTWAEQICAHYKKII